MNIDAMYQTTYRDVTKGQGTASSGKGILTKIIKLLSFDAEGIFKSKDWPQLWQK